LIVAPVTKISAATIAAKSSNLSLNFRTTGYTFLLVCIFIGQVALIIFIKFCYLRKKIIWEEKQYWERNKAWKDFQTCYNARCKQERETFKKHLEDMD